MTRQVTALLATVLLTDCNVEVGDAMGRKCSEARPCPDELSCVETADGGVCVRTVCQDIEDCVAGMVCVSNTCRALCARHSDCVEGFLCDDVCLPDASPWLKVVSGNGSDSCPDAEQGRCFADGLVVEGHNLADTEFELRGTRTWALAARGVDDTHQHVTLMLPVDLVEGSYTLAAFNQAGSDQESVTILKGEPGDTGSYQAGVGVTIVGDTISVDFGTNAGQVADGNAVATLQAHLNELQARIAALEGATLGNTTLQVGPTATYADLAAALTFLADKRIAADARVTIQIADGVYTSTTAVEIAHPDGARIEILGNVTNPGNVTLTFNGNNGITMWGSNLGRLDGVTILGDQTIGTNGIAVANGWLICGAGVIVDGFGVGLYARGGFIDATNTSSLNNNYFGYLAEFGGYLRASAANAIGNERVGFVACRNGVVEADWAVADSNGIGFSAESNGMVLTPHAFAMNNSNSGFSAILNGTIDAFLASATDNGGYGFAASYDGAVLAWGATADGNGDAGFFAHRGGVINATDSTSTNNDDYGYGATIGGIIDAHNTTVTGNTSGDFSPAAGALSTDGAYIEP